MSQKRWQNEREGEAAHGRPWTCTARRKSSRRQDSGAAALFTCILLPPPAPLLSPATPAKRNLAGGGDNMTPEHSRQNPLWREHHEPKGKACGLWMGAERAEDKAPLSEMRGFIPLPVLLAGES